MATLVTAGTQSITATDTANAAITGAQAGITVDPAGAASLALAGYPTPATAGETHAVTATLLDRYGNVATSYSGTVHLTSSDPRASLASDYTFTNSSSWQ